MKLTKQETFSILPYGMWGQVNCSKKNSILALLYDEKWLQLFLWSDCNYFSYFISKGTWGQVDTTEK